VSAAEVRHQAQTDFPGLRQHTETAAVSGREERHARGATGTQPAAIVRHVEPVELDARAVVDCHAGTQVELPVAVDLVVLEVIDVEVAVPDRIGPRIDREAPDREPQVQGQVTGGFLDVARTVARRVDLLPRGNRRVEQAVLPRCQYLVGHTPCATEVRELGLT
jgi:hypothetical protein